MRSELLKTLGHHLRKRELIRPGSRVGIAVSGGADSVALLLLFLELRKQLGMVLSVVHFNHKLRGKASDADEKFVATLAGKYGLECFTASENIAAKAKRERVNLEDAGRRSRYAFFERLVAEGKLDRIAVAHTADDQAETVLAHILRGTGLAGLAGIHPEAGVIFRPLLAFRRSDLRKYLRSRGQRWREDATNQDTSRLRARIRRKLIPFLEKQFQTAVVEHLCQLADLARADEEWMEFSAGMRVSAFATEEHGEIRVSLANLLGPRKMPEQSAGEDGREFQSGQRAMASRMVRQMVKMAKPHGGQLSAVHVAAVLQLAEQPWSGKRLQLPGGVEVRRERDALYFRAASRGRREGAISQPAKSFLYEAGLDGGDVHMRIVELSSVLHLQVIDWPGEGRETNVTEAILDHERLAVPLLVRSWRPGDAFQPLGHQKPHKLARLWSERGVSRWEKHSWPVLTSGGRIAWARGLPVAAEFAAGPGTRKAVVITEERDL